MTDKPHIQTSEDALAERVEGAAGPDVQLDADIRDCLDLPNDYAADWRGWGFGPNATPTERPKAFPYTSSLDAAMTLVPEGWKALMDFRASPGVVDLYHPDYDPNDWLLLPVVQGAAATPALALTAASLRARVSGEPR